MSRSEEELAKAFAARQRELVEAKAAKLRQSTMAPAEIRALAEAAIARQRCLRLGYHGYFRTVEVHIVGQLTTGREAISGYQVKGGSVGYESVGWKNLKFDDVISAEIDELRSTAPRPDYNPEDPGFPVKYRQV